MRLTLWTFTLMVLTATLQPVARADKPVSAATTTTAPVTTTAPIVLELNPADLPAAPGYRVIDLKLRINGKSVLFPCGIDLPPGYFHGTDKLPVVIGLHNKVAIGTDRPATLSDEAFGFSLTHDTYDGRASGLRPAKPVWFDKEAPFVALIPECPKGYLWESPAMETVIGLLVDQALTHCRGDRDRVYLTGFSYGGSSTWVVASALPDVFAAIAPIDGRATTGPADTVARLRNTAVYMVVGGSDRDFLPEAQRMRDALSALPHPNFVSRVLPGGNHFCYSMVYTDPVFWDWMLSQRRTPGPPPPIAPASSKTPAKPASKPPTPPTSHPAARRPANGL